MIIDSINIVGFRNFENTTIYFQKSNLIFGANDVGKTNLLYALRIFFDKSLSTNDIELTDADFNAFTKANKIRLQIHIRDIKEDVLRSHLKGYIKDNEMIIRYEKEKGQSPVFSIGHCSDTLDEIQGRIYLRYLNLEYVNSSRDLKKFFLHERNKILEYSKTIQSKEKQEQDNKTIHKLQENLQELNKQIGTLNYVSDALNQVNKNLKELSMQNEDQAVSFLASTNDVDELLKNLDLQYSTDGLLLKLGGDGRNNQIYLASWISKQKTTLTDEQITIYAIEEPEAHLHPHQQRKLSDFLNSAFPTQTFITTHSPTIVSAFNPINLIRLYSEHKSSTASCASNDQKVQSALEKINYRLSPLLAEVFFSDGVFLVEGPSETLFYKKCAEKLELDLDRRNISILSVNGVGFEPYIAICEALNIPWVMRTDNDIFKNQGSDTYFYAGLNRILVLIKSLGLSDPDSESVSKMYVESYSKVDKQRKNIDPSILKVLSNKHFYLANIDLEEDLCNSKMYSDLSSYYKISDKTALISKMCERKAENMFSYISSTEFDFSKLRDDSLLVPLNGLIKFVEQRIHPQK